MANTKENLLHKFQYHPLDESSQREAVTRLYAEAWRFVCSVLEEVPECSSRDLSIQRTKEALLLAIEGMRESESKV
jgi:hypothetical protein